MFIQTIKISNKIQMIYTDKQSNILDYCETTEDMLDEQFEHSIMTENKDCYDVFNTETNLFTNNISSDDKSIDKKIEECFSSRTPKLKLKSFNFTELPDILTTFEWVTYLEINSTKITELKNLPPNLTNLDCCNNNIEILDGSILPSTLKILKFVKNKTRKIINLKEGLIDIDFSDNLLEEICSIPISTQTLDLSENCNFIHFPNLLENTNLIALSLNRTEIYTIDEKLIPNCIKILETCSCDKLTKITWLPCDLIEWKSYCCNIDTITCKFPVNLKNLDLYNNNLEEIPDFPEHIIECDLGLNNLKSLPTIPKTIKKLDIEKNKNLIITDDIKSVNMLDDVNITYDKPDSSELNDIFNTTEIMKQYEMLKLMNDKTFDEQPCDKYDESNEHYIILKCTYIC